MITLNLMHEIVIGKRTVEEAGHVYAEKVAGYTMGRPAPYAERLLFPLMNGGTQDPDEGMGMMPILNQAGRQGEGHGHRETERADCSEKSPPSICHRED